MARIRIGDLMVRAGLIDEMQLQSALSYQRQWGGRLGDILVAQGFLDEMMLWRGLSRQLEVPLVSLPDVAIPAGIIGLVPLEMAERLELFPIARDERTLTVATSEPNNIGALDELAFRTGLKVRAMIAPAREIDWAIRVHYRGSRDPCPPPRTRMTAAAAPSPLAPTHETQLDATPGQAAAAAPTAPPTAAPTAPPTAVQTPLSELAQPRTTGAPSPAPATSGGVVDEQLHRQTVDTLRAVIELCVARGVFTRDELWQVVQRQGTNRPR